MNSTISRTPPPDFRPTVEVAGCFCVFEDKILYVLRHPEKPQGGTWGLPAGKLEPGESARDAAVREVFEEVGILIDPRELIEIGQHYIRLNSVDYVFHAFEKKFSTMPSLVIDPNAHIEAKWVTLDGALKLPLIIGGKEVIEMYREKL